MKQRIFNGKVYTRDNKTGYYLGTSKPRKRLHRAVWEYYHGEIPKGYVVHHIDHNKENNDISNLQLVTDKEHHEIHKREMSEELKERLRENVIKNAVPKAVKWHKSKEGKEWHRKQYEISLALVKPTKHICLNCGKEYMTKQGKFCSNKCKSAYRRKSGVDNETRKCKLCGKEFIINKYSKKECCSRTCASKIGHQTRQRRCL